MPPATSTDALKQLQTYQQGMAAPDALVQEANKQYGVDQAGQNLSGLRSSLTRTSNLLNQVAPSVYGRTRQSLVSSAQAGRQIANEQAPIQQNLSDLGQNYNTAYQDYQDSANRANQAAQLRSTGQQSQLSYLQQIYSNLQSSEQAARDEAFRQAQLAEQTRQFNANLAASKAAAGSSASGLAGLLGGGGTSGSGQSAVAPSRQTLATGAAQTAKDQLLRIYGSGQVAPFARERVLQSLQRQFPDVPANVLSDIIYKQVFPDGWDGSTQGASASQQRGVMSAVGYS